MVPLFAVLTGSPGGETVETGGEEGRPQAVHCAPLPHSPGYSWRYRWAQGLCCRLFWSPASRPMLYRTVSFSLLSFVKTKVYLHISGCVSCLSWSHSKERWALASSLWDSPRGHCSSQRLTPVFSPPRNVVLNLYCQENKGIDLWKSNQSQLPLPPVDAA